VDEAKLHLVFRLQLAELASQDGGVLAFGQESGISGRADLDAMSRRCAS
jgi:hypothetical protein